MEDLSSVNLRLVTCLDDLLELRRWLGERREILGVDTETGGLDWWREPLRTVQFGDEHTGWTVPFADWGGAVRELLAAYEGPMVAHNVKFDAHFLLNHDVPVRRHLWHDTRPLAHLVDARVSTGLKEVGARRISPMVEFLEHRLRSAMNTSRWDWRTVPVDFEPYWQYAAFDPVLTSRLWRVLAPEVRALGSWAAYETEVASSWVLLDMERRGARLDLEHVAASRSALDAEAEEVRRWIEAEFGLTNPAQNARVIDALRDAGARWTKLTDKGNLACDEEVLAALAPEYPLAGGVLKYRELTKLSNTYYGNFQSYADGDLLHPSINPLGARTGRQSVSRPSLQNLPRAQRPRDAFIAREGHVLVAHDYDQIEMRLLAIVARDEAMLAAIRRGDELTAAGFDGYDVHSANARGIYGIAEDQPVPKAQRQITKNAGFAKAYCAGVEQFALTARVTPSEAKGFLALYDQTFPGVARLQRDVMRVASERQRREGLPYVKAPDGRRHLADDVRKSYVLVNYLLQGYAAAVFKRKLVELDAAGLADYAVLPIHDEILSDVPAEEADDFVREASRVLTQEADEIHLVALTASGEKFARWGDKYAAS